MIRFAAIVSIVLWGVLLTGGAAPALAQSRPGPAATQHALDELANAIAQGKITRTPTPSLTTTPMPAPTATAQPAAPPPTQPPESSAAPPAPDQPLPVPDLGQSMPAYVRPSPLDPSGTWLELALPQGRWTVLYDTTLCAPPAAWTNVWLALDDQSERPITADRDGGDGAMCALSQWTWTSDVPCAADDQGTCDMKLDGAFWEAVGQVEPPPTDTDTPIPMPAPAPAPLVQPTPVPRPPIAAAPPPPPAAPRVEVVVETVVVEVTSEPTATDLSTPTALPTSTPVPTATVAPTSVPTPTMEPTSTDIALVASDISATPEPTAAMQPDQAAAAPIPWNWGLTFVVLAVALGLVAIWLFVARAGPVMW